MGRHFVGMPASSACPRHLRVYRETRTMQLRLWVATWISPTFRVCDLHLRWRWESLRPCPTGDRSLCLVPPRANICRKACLANGTCNFSQHGQDREESREKWKNSVNFFERVVEHSSHPFTNYAPLLHLLMPRAGLKVIPRCRRGRTCRRRRAC